MPLPFLAPLLLKAKLLPWRWIIAGIAVLAVVWSVWTAIARFGDRREAEGKAAQIALYEAAEAKATAEHNDRLAKAEERHNAATQTLRQERDAALARPATRVIRVPVSAVCPTPVAADAGVPVQPAADQLLEIDDPGYGVFRDWLYHYAGASGEGR